MNYGPDKDICICNRLLDGTFLDYPRPYWLAMPSMRPSRYPDGDDCWYLETDFHIRIKDRIFTIKKGFDFDGASIPKKVWSIIGHPMQMWILLAALPHDGWYASNLISRKEADNLFLEIIQACDRATPLQKEWKVSKSLEEYARWKRRNECYAAVYAFGGSVYPKSYDDLIKYRAFVSVQFAADKPLERLLA
jgi:hypothetical protein